MDLEIKRQIVHSMGIFTILLILIFGRLYSSLMMLSISIILILIAEYRKSKLVSKVLKIEAVKEVEDMIDKGLRSYERLDEMPLNGAVLFYLGCFLVTVVFEPWLAIASIAVLALADSLSTLVGYYFGEHKIFINNKKSWEGSSAFFITAFFVLLFFVNPLKAFFVALLVTLVEMLPKINDNISVPFATAVFLSLVINI